MRLSRFWPRFTVRRLMVAVAIVGTMTGVGVELASRRARFNDLAAMYRRKVLAGMRGEILFSDPYPRGHPDGNSAYRKRTFSLRNHYELMNSKYTYAASYPWLPVALDPPEPQLIASPQERQIWFDGAKTRRDRFAELPFNPAPLNPPPPE